MWGHLLPTTIVVLSHILSISPSAAAPQNFILPQQQSRGVVDIIPKSYDEISFEDSSSNDEKNYPLVQPSTNNLIDDAILLNNGIQIPLDLVHDDIGTLQAKLDLLESNSNNQHLMNTVPSAFDPRMTLRRPEHHTLWELMKQSDRTTGNDNQMNLNGIDHQQERGALNFWIQKPIREPLTTPLRENLPLVPLIRNEKRSPRCLRRCLAQGLLHPSQCHSLC